MNTSTPTMPFPTSTASHDPSPAPLEFQPWKSSHELSGVQQDLRRLASESENLATFLPQAAFTIGKHFRTLGIVASGRIGQQDFRDFAALGRLSTAQRQQIVHQLEQASGRCDGQPGTYRSETTTFAGQSVRYLVIGERQPQFTASFGFCIAADGRESETMGHLRWATELAFLQTSLLAQLVESKHSNRTSQPMDLVPQLSRYGSTREFAFALVSHLSERFACQQVALGIVSGPGVIVQAISGRDDFKASSPGVVDIQQAMEETLDAGRLCTDQPSQTSQAHHPMPVHTRWGQQTHSAICSVPLQVDQRCVAVVTLSRASTTGFTAEDLSQLQSIVLPYGPAIELALRGQRSLTEHCKARMQELATVVRQPQSAFGKRMRWLVAVTTLAFLLGWLPFKPTARCTVIPADLTQSLAPFDLQLSDVMVHAGDKVEAGQVLARFDTRAFELQRSQLQAQREQAEVDVRAALVQGDAARASLAKANSAAYQAQLDAVEQKIALCTLTAPQDGMVVECELERNVGQVFSQGSRLLSFAPMKDFDLEIYIPESDARHIEAQQRGSFASSADPGNDLKFTIESVSGAAQLIDGKNVFVARARLDGDSPNFRQGMEGFAKTQVGWRPIPWLALHRIYDYARVNFWF